MIVNGTPLNVTPLNETGTPVEPPWSQTGAVLLPLEQVIGGEVDRVVLPLRQVVREKGVASLHLQQVIGPKAGSVVLPIRQQIAATGAAVMGILQTVYTVDSMLAASWDVRVVVGGVDFSAQLVGTISIEAARNSARLADFELLVTGSVNPSDWHGKAVWIDYSGTDYQIRRFTGLIADFAVDLDRRTVRCTATDDLQSVVDALSREQLSAVLPGSWSPNVFSADNKGWNYAQDLLTVTDASLELDSNRQVRVNDYYATADYQFDNSRVLDGSLAVQFAQRGRVMNQAVIEYSFRFERLYERRQGISWSIPVTLCAYLDDPFGIPDREMAKSAVSGGGYELVNIGYTPLWPSNLDTLSPSALVCNGNVRQWDNQFPEGIIGFRATAAKRWMQSLTRTVSVTVNNPLSQSRYGVLKETLSASSSAETSLPDWGSFVDGYTPRPPGFVSDGNGNAYIDDWDEDAVRLDLQTLLAQASVRMAQSHRANSISFEVPLFPVIELHHGVGVALPELTATAPIIRWRESYDLDAGKATTQIELGVSIGDDDVTQMSVPSVPVYGLPVPQSDSVLSFGGSGLRTYIGGRADSPAEYQDLVGFITTRIKQNRGGRPGAPKIEGPEYPVQFQIEFDAIDPVLTDSQEIRHTYQLDVVIPANPLTLHF